MPPPLTPSLILDPAYQSRDDLIAPTAGMLELPEKVMQFGTGGFLRAFADYFIDEANRQGVFSGRVVMVGSTGSKRTSLLNAQGGLYTVRVQGVRKGDIVEEHRVICSVSRALSAKDHWDEVVQLAKSPDLELVISNTTELGVVYDPDDTYAEAAPRSFPGKLTAVLFERATHYSYAPDRGLVVLPCELITQNGDTLKSIVMKLAEDWALGDEFMGWLNTSVYFCNTLVDRIVPGTPAKDVLDALYNQLGYTDAMLTNAEVYKLWPIEGPPEALERITFARANPDVVLTEDVHPYKERKVRILNGAHTSSVPVAFLMGEETVIGMMENPKTAAFVRNVMLENIVPSLDVPGGVAFAEEVLDRFKNPFLRHKLIDISWQSTSKWRLRLLPSIQRYYEKHNALPLHICAGFAAYLVFMRGVSEKDGVIYGEWNGQAYPIRDDQASFYKKAWADVDATDQQAVQTFVTSICKHEPFWGNTLTAIPGFNERITMYCWQILTEGIEKTVEELH